MKRTLGFKRPLLQGTLSFLSVSALASGVVDAPEVPHIELHRKGPLFDQKCLANTAHSKHYEKLVQWQLTCPRETFVGAVRETLKEAPDSDPELRLLAARIGREEARKLRDEIEKNFHEEKAGRFEFQELLTLDGWENFFFPKTGERRESLGRVPSPQSLSREGRVLSGTAALVSEVAGWLAPVRTAPDNSPLSSLREEAALEVFLAYGQTLRFQAAFEILGRGELNLRRSWISERVLTEVMSWVAKDGGGPLREWLRAELAQERPAEITGAKARHLDVWLESLLLEGGQGDTERAKRDWVLARLRELWVAYPATGDATKIRAAAERLGVSREFRAPTMAELNLKELLTRAQSQVRLLDGNGALRTVRRVLALPSEGITKEDYWTALQLHVRILRILDQRPQIAGVIKSFEAKAHFRTVGPDEDLARGFGRQIDMAKHYWTYESGAAALPFLDSVLADERAPESVRIQAHYVKARILEQARRPDEAMAAIHLALERKGLPADLTADLVWRKIFLLFDRLEVFGGLSPPRLPSSSAKEILETIAQARKLAADSFDRGRVLFWSARAYEWEGRTEDAKKSYRDAYKVEALSYYSNLSGLALERLGELPKDWNAKATESHDEPDIQAFLKFPQKGTPLQFARVYALARIGDSTGIDRALPELGKSVADDLLTKSQKVSERRKLGRAVAWLRRAVGDAFGSLKTSEVARTAYAEDFEGEDYSFLYPLPYWKLIQSMAQSNELDPWVVASLIRQESAFDSAARSPANALGLMQMIPPVAKAEAKKLGLADFEPEQLYAPEIAVKLGSAHLGGLVKGFGGSLICSFASYNAGRPPVDKWLGYYPSADPLSFVERIPYQETRNYVRSILRNFINYQRIYGSGKVDFTRLVQMPSKGEPAVLPVHEGDKKSEAIELEVR